MVQYLRTEFLAGIRLGRHIIPLLMLSSTANSGFVHLDHDVVLRILRQLVPLHCVGYDGVLEAQSRAV